MPPKKSLQSHVYVVLRTDYLDADDHEGRTTVISVHGTLHSANASAKEHVKAQAESQEVDDPNTKESTFDNGTQKFVVIIGDEDYHSYAVEVIEEALVDGSQVDTSHATKPAKAPAKANSAATKKSAPAKSAPAKSVPAKTKATKAKAAKAESEDDEDDIDDKEGGNDDVDVFDVPDADDEAPQGAANCLAGKTFLITGTLEGFNRKEAEALIEQYGGTTEKTLKKTLDYVILGVKAGDKKLEQIQEWGLKKLNQKGLYDLIANSPAGGSKRSAEPAPETKTKKPAKRAKKA